MYDAPSLTELVSAVKLFLSETARPQLTGHAAFHARVAENVLAIVERELATADVAKSAAHSRLSALLGADDSASLEDMTRQLSQKLRDGSVDLNTPGLLAHLKASAIAELKVDQPKYSGLAIATKDGQN